MLLQIIQQRQVLFELFQVRVHGVVSSRNRDYEESDCFPRQGWWVEKIFLKAQRPEQLQEQSHGRPG